MTTMMTRAEQERRFQAAGVEGHALDALLRETAPARHAARVQAALVAARNHYLSALKLSADEVSPGTLDAGAASVLWADVAGIGGRDGVEGHATERLEAFRKCGKGRKQGTDGPAWSAAILAAARSANGLFHAADGLSFAGACGSVRCDPQIPPAWQMSLAREGLRRAAGLPSWHPDVPMNAGPETLPEWAALVNRLEKERCPYLDEDDVERWRSEFCAEHNVTPSGVTTEREFDATGCHTVAVTFKDMASGSTACHMKYPL